MLSRIWTVGIHFFTAGGSPNLYMHSGNQLLVPQKIGNSNTQHTTPEHIPKDATTSHKDACSTIFIAALFIIAKNGSNTNVPQLKSRTCGPFTQLLR